MDSNDWFGVVRWHSEDIADALEQYGFAPSEANIAAIRRKCDHSAFREAMIETGWHYINAYIEECSDSLQSISAEVSHG